MASSAISSSSFSGAARAAIAPGRAAATAPAPRRCAARTITRGSSSTCWTPSRARERALSLRSARLDDEGHVVNDERQLQVKIPKGVREGQHIRLAGRGGPGFGGGPPGDLLLEVVFKPDPRWRAEGRDVYQRLPLAPWEAALGAAVEVHTPSGDAEVTVPAGWKPGRKLRLKGRGIPGAQPGDLYLELEIALPPATTDAARDAYAALGRAFPGFDARRANGA